MTDIMVLQTPHELASVSSSTQHVTTPTENDGFQQETTCFSSSSTDIIIRSSPTSSSTPVGVYRRNTTSGVQEEGGGGGRERKRREREEQQQQRQGDQVSLLEVLVSVFRKSLVGSCSKSELLVGGGGGGGVVEGQQLSDNSRRIMEISWPNNVRHVAHVTFDRFNGFLGLPVEFEPEVPRRPPSASVRVFGVSTESMQLSFDARGNSVPTILLMMQRRLYSQGGLQAEGIFRINAENGQEEYVREQLNSGVVPDDIDVHCLAGLIKAWFRELPMGILDSLSPDEVMQAQTEDECVRLVRLLPPTEAALLDWAINLMADVAQLEHHNKMNARNIAMVFAPNMTQMADPLTALMYAVQVMNFLKTLITRTLRDREDSIVEAGPAPDLEPSDENGHYGASQPIVQENIDLDKDEEGLIVEKPLSDRDAHSTSGELDISNQTPGFLGSILNILPDGEKHVNDEKFYSECPNADTTKDRFEGGDVITGRGRTQSRSRRTRTGKSGGSDLKKGTKKIKQKPSVHVGMNTEKSRDISIISLLNAETEREAWR